MKLTNFKNSIIGILVVYVFLYMIMPAFANFLLAATLVLLIPYLVYRLLFRNKFYRNSISGVDKKFIAGVNTLANDFCSATYVPDKSIIVTEILSGKRRDRRMFSLTPQQLNINKAWYRICRIFDYYTSIDILKEFFDNDTRVLIVTIKAETPEREEKTASQEEQKEEFVELNSVSPDSFGADFGKQNEVNAAYISMDSLSEKKEAAPKPRTSGEVELNDFGALTDKFGKKVDVNTATAEQLAELPGINIVGAKKIIEHRNLNGYFKSGDEFIAVSNAKPHFVSKIRDMIEVRTPADDGKKDTGESSGRIIDF